MPATRLGNKYSGKGRLQSVKVPPADRLLELINRYQKAHKLTAEELGQRLGGKSSAAVKCKKNRGTDSWTVEDVRHWCKVLRITDATEVGKAILRQ